MNMLLKRNLVPVYILATKFLVYHNEFCSLMKLGYLKNLILDFRFILHNI